MSDEIRVCIIILSLILSMFGTFISKFLKTYCPFFNILSCDKCHISIWKTLSTFDDSNPFNFRLAWLSDKTII